MDSSNSPPSILFDDSDIDRQLAWHRSRLDSKHQANQARALQHLLSFNRQGLFHLSSVTVSGARHTRPELFQNVFSSLLGPQQPRPLADILHSTDELYRQLAGLGLFSHLQLSLAPVPDQPNGIVAMVKLVERSRYFLKTSTDVGNGEGALTCLARARNLWGRGDILEASVGLGSTTRASCQLRGEFPIWAAKARCEISGYACERDLGGFASCSESIKGAVAKLRSPTSLGSHELSYEISTRSLGSLRPTASISIREAAGDGPSLKSALSHVWMLDTRDQTPFPTKGGFVRLSQEYAGLGGDANHFKSNLESAISRPLLSSHCILTLGFQSGWICPLGGRPAVFHDRFQLGGPTSVRMFRINSLGPKDGNDHLGGQLYWAAGMSILTDIPKISDWPLKFHTFINAGRLSNSWDKLSSNAAPSIGVGVGLVGKLQGVRLEANVGVPIAIHRGDGCRTGLQVGLGIGFLS